MRIDHLVLEALATFAVTVYVYWLIVRPWYRYFNPPKPPRYTKERGQWHTWPPEQRGYGPYVCASVVVARLPDYTFTFN